ncbi:hypothetical protein [Dyadobacter sp. NIV53]|uniref:hypothetical protein n=1 Tax=Dyadobacter sp. NIV53 TaxID=2861765 RepID=UPI001C875D24|nr:hypothetical protein [Dyadobacter sp. NIV53]
MNEKQINQLATEGFFSGKPLEGALEETHISWVILSKKFVFKIKKPVNLSFLDFSTLPKRKELCEKELLLNKRFSSIYLSVVPIRCVHNRWTIGEGEGEIVDYAVMMKRLDPAKRMDKLLVKNRIPASSVSALARNVARFHLRARVIKAPFILNEAISTYNDILSISKFVRDNLGENYVRIIEKSIAWSGEMLIKLKTRIDDRVCLGFKRDVHGDLHAGNIFAYKQPIVFDCIEFNDSYRQIDVMSEIAFLCMDLEAYNRRDLEQTFITTYKKAFDCFTEPEDDEIFNYYKCLRANIRAKVHAINCEQAENEFDREFHLGRVKSYLRLIAEYADIG